eukprot:gb/GFBE01042999.1/.p1 GENE.gb/GFBE01042999.1/~~gb/GFBE01042999.1/.p1  ORF type:complete len:552 (+),score=131.31 gb/GFBE01042999.1/:1-1656(+)
MPRPCVMEQTSRSLPLPRPSLASEVSTAVLPPNVGGMDLCQLKSALRALQLQQEQSLASIITMMQALEVSAGSDSSWSSASTEIKDQARTDSKERRIDVEVMCGTGHGNIENTAVVEVPDPKATTLQVEGALAGGDDGKLETLESQGSRFSHLLADHSADFVGRPQTFRQACKWLITRQQFDWAMGLIILLNSICIGIETQLSIDKDANSDWPGEAMDLIFITIYVIEISIRLVANGRDNFKDYWFNFDLVLVVLGFASNVAMPIVFSVVNTSGGDVGAFQKILVIRALRLLRLIRAIRMLHMFRTVWRLVYGLLTSGNAMLSTLFLLLLTLYIFACLGIELITKDEHLASHEETAWIVSYHFGSLPRTLATLMAFVCADSVAGIYMPIIVQRPWLVIYFVLLLLMVSVALMNLVTAVLVEGALENASNDKELERHDLKTKVKKTIPKIMALFAEYDDDGSGTLTREEVAQVPLDALPAEMFDETIESMQDIFELLDVTGDGSLTQVEFADGLLNLFTQGVPIQTIQMMKLLQINNRKVDFITQKLEAMGV